MPFSLQATALGMNRAYYKQSVEVAAVGPEMAAIAVMRGRRLDIVMHFV